MNVLSFVNLDLARTDRSRLWPILMASTLLFGMCHQTSAMTVASDNAANPAYAMDETGAWKGLNPTEGENPPGMDNGGFGFQTWDFQGGLHNPNQSPYGNLNHFIDGVDFTPREANDLGSPAFGLTNAGSAPIDGFFGYTARATRVFDKPLTVGQTFSIDFDNPVPQPLDAFAASGFLFRLNTGGGPIINDAPLPGVVERFGVFTTSNFNEGRWYTTDSVEFADTTVAGSSTASGATFQFTLTGTDTYEMSFRTLSDEQVLFSRSGTLNNAGAGPVDTIEITLFSNGSSSTGSREFFFNNLQIASDNDLLIGDYNQNGTVDAADYTVWRDALGQMLPNGTGADGNGDGIIDAMDYDVWVMHFGEMAPTSATVAVAVPEPTSMLQASFSLGCVFLGLLLSRRTSRRISTTTHEQPRERPAGMRTVRSLLEPLQVATLPAAHD